MKRGKSTAKKDKKKIHGRYSMFSAGNYIQYFLIICFVVSVSISILLHSINIDLNFSTLKARAIPTLINIFFLSALITVIEGIKRRITVKNPVDKILDATRKIMDGDYSARIETSNQKIRKQNEFDAIIENFNKMAQEISGTETLRTDFIANVSHELKTPLAVIQNYSTIIQSPDIDDETRNEYAKAIHIQTKRLTNLITNILKLNKLENQQILPESDEYNLSEQLCEDILMFEEVLENKNIDLETEIPDNVRINCDAELLSLVWNNLISNAIKFTKDNGNISIRLFDEGETIKLIVRDNGCGMNEEIQKRIFEKFYQGDVSHSGNGNGLGLALVKRVLDMVGGSIKVESQLNYGSTFTVTLKKQRE